MSLPPEFADLSPEKRALFELLQAETEERAGTEAGPPLTKRPAGTSLVPLTPAQVRARFVDRAAPETPANYPLIIEIKGPFQPALLAQSLVALGQRHPILRTQCLNVAGADYQRVTPPWHLPLPLTSLSDLPPAAQRAAIDRAARQEASQVVAIDRGRPLRARLLQLAEGRFVLLLTLHYFVVDGWGVRLLLRELFATYQARAFNRPVDLPANELQYADFAWWQRQWLASEAYERQLAFWRAQLAPPPPLELPTDWPRPPRQTYNGRRTYFTMEAALAQALRAFSRRHQLTLFTTLMTAFQALLGHISGQDDFLVGTNVSNRQQANLAEVVGNFSNQIPLRAQLSGNPTFLELAARTQAMGQAVFARQQVPTEALAEALGLLRDPSRPLLSPATFVLHRQPLLPDVAGLQLTLLPGASVVMPYDLSLTFYDSAGGLTGMVQYNTDLFHEDTIGGWLAHLRTLLALVVDRPDTPFTDLLPAALKTALAGDRQARQTTPAPSGVSAMTGAPDDGTSSSGAGGGALRAIWQAVLGGAVQAAEDFFKAGGDSLRLAHLMAQVNYHFRVEVPIADFMRRPTLAHLEQLLRTATGGQAALTIDFPPGYPPPLAVKGTRFLPRIPHDAPLRRKAVHALLEIMPQPQGERLLAWVLERRWVQEKLLRRRTDGMRRWLALLDCSENDVVCEKFLARTLCYGYLQVLRRPIWGRRVSESSARPAPLAIHGEAQIAGFQQQGRGVIIVSYHTQLRHWKRFLLAPDYVVHFAQSADAIQTWRRGYAEQISIARRILAEGGVVAISADGHQGTSAAYVAAFHGRRRPFYTGFAELAVLTGAVVIPLRPAISADGDISFHYGKPWSHEIPGLNPAARVEALVEQYIDFVARAWCEMPWLVPWNHVYKHLAQEPIGGVQVTAGPPG